MMYYKISEGMGCELQLQEFVRASVLAVSISLAPVISKVHPRRGLDKWKVSHFQVSCFLIGHAKDRLTLILKDKTYHCFFFFPTNAQLLHG